MSTAQIVLRHLNLQLATLRLRLNPARLEIKEPCMPLNPDDLWYEKNKKAKFFLLLLWHLSLLFGTVSALRRFFYRHGMIKSQSIKAAVIIVGGITVGGSGKTPLSIALLKKLKAMGYTPGLISRGYKGKSDIYPLLVSKDTLAELCGDEPLLIKRSVLDEAMVAVDPNRVRGAKALCEKGCDVILSDDGMQHYSLRRDAEIVVLDGQRLLGNGFLLPAGPLREGKWRLKTCDMVVCNGGNATPTGAHRMDLKLIYPQPLNKNTAPLAPKSKVWVLAGIGNPNRVRDSVKSLGFEIAGMLTPGDHGKVKLDDLTLATSTHPVVMTAKDAVKYSKCDVSGLYVLEVKAALSQDFDDAFRSLVKNSLQQLAKRVKLDN